MRTVLSELAEASRVRPSRVNAETLVTVLVWPSSWLVWVPVVGSQMRTVLSPLAEASRVRPSRVNAHTP